MLRVRPVSDVAGATSQHRAGCWRPQARLRRKGGGAPSFFGRTRARHDRAPRSDGDLQHVGREGDETSTLQVGTFRRAGGARSCMSTFGWRSTDHVYHQAAACRSMSRRARGSRRLRRQRRRCSAANVLGHRGGHCCCGRLRQRRFARSPDLGPMTLLQRRRSGLLQRHCVPTAPGCDVATQNVAAHRAVLQRRQAMREWRQPGVPQDVESVATAFSATSATSPK